MIVMRGPVRKLQLQVRRKCDSVWVDVDGGVNAVPVGCDSWLRRRDASGTTI
jgi:hypothetical protein